MYGWGPFSDPVMIKASDVPLEPAIVTTTTIGTNVRINFKAPFYNGDEITKYTIMIAKKSNGESQSPSCIASLIEADADGNWYC